jgi:hypothetical protein
MRRRTRIENRESRMETRLAVSLRSILSLVVVCYSMTFLTGCSGDFRGPADPLLGNYTPGPGQAAALPPGPLPPLPAPSSTASNAALASHPFRPLDGSHDLRIPSRGAPPNPQAEFTPVNRPSPIPTLSHGIGAETNTYEQAQARITALGPTWQRLESQGNPAEWQFSCSIPNRQNPSISRTYQAQGQTALAAMQAVLEQIDREQR